MSQEGKIIDYLGENKYVVLLPEEKEWDGNPDEIKIKIAHDYVEIEGSSDFEMNLVKGKYPYETIRGAANWRSSKASIQIPIRDMIDVVLPLLKNHSYLQQEHLKDKLYVENDPNYEIFGFKEPRYLKGDQYPAYAYQGSIIKYNDNESDMIKFRRSGSKKWETVTLSTFNLIKNSLKLSYDQI